MPERPTILVTDARLGCAISIIRSLSRHGWRAIGGDADRACIGFRSRHAAERLVYPSPTRFPAEFVRCIAGAVSEYGIDLIIPVTDAAILPLSQERSRLPATCRMAMPDADVLGLAIDKERTLALAAELGIPIPRSVRVESVAAATEVAARFGWPVVLKPTATRVYRDNTSIETFEVAYAGGPDDMAVRLQRYGGRCEILVQEYCAGVGYGVGLLMHEGRPLAAFQHRRVHEVPLTGGVSSLRESVPLDPVLYEHSVRLLGAMRWTGLAMVEFKVGTAGPVLMEVNGRVWGSLPLAVFSGVDFPRLLAELCLFGSPVNSVAPQLRYRVGVRARNLTLDLAWIAAALSGLRQYPFLGTPGRVHGLLGFLKLLDPLCHSDTLAIDDPGPGLAEVSKLVAMLWQKFRKDPACER